MDDWIKTVQALMSSMIERNISIAAAESCTGGMLSSIITKVPGVSSIFMGGVVSYSNQAKIKMINVNPETLDNYGAVSSNTALEMARGVRKAFGTDIGISTTGVAGPGGGTKDKPVGLVYIGISIGEFEKSIELRLDGDREEIRLNTCKKAFEHLNEMLAS